MESNLPTYYQIDQNIDTKQARHLLCDFQLVHADGLNSLCTKQRNKEKKENLHK